MKAKEKKKAVELRKQGYSLNEISDLLKVSKSTASTWLRGIELSHGAQATLDKKYTNGQVASQKAHRDNTKRRLVEAQRKADKTLENFILYDNHKKVLCAVMYWCEGSKTTNDSDFAFTNSDPIMVQTFLLLLRDSFNIEETKLRVHMHLHRYHLITKQLDFWSKVTNIPKNQFAKAHISNNMSKHTREGYEGCIRIRYHDVILAREIQALARAFMSKVNKGAIS